MTLSVDRLTLKVCSTSDITWSKSVRNLSEIEQSAAELLIILEFLRELCHAVTLTLKFYSTLHFVFHAFKLYKIWAKLNNGWVIDDIACFAVQFYGAGTTDRGFLGVHWTNFTTSGEDNHCSIALVFQHSDILLHFQTWAAQILSDLKTTINFALLTPLGEN